MIISDGTKNEPAFFLWPADAADYKNKTDGRAIHSTAGERTGKSVTPAHHYKVIFKKGKILGERLFGAFFFSKRCSLEPVFTPTP